MRGDEGHGAQSNALCALKMVRINTSFLYANSLMTLMIESRSRPLKVTPIGKDVSSEGDCHKKYI